MIVDDARSHTRRPRSVTSPTPPPAPEGTAQGSRRVIEEPTPMAQAGARVRDQIMGWAASPAFDVIALMVIGGLLITTGLVMVGSSASVGSIARGGSGFAGLLGQAIFAGIGLVGLVVAALVPPGVYRKLAWILLALGLVLQMLVHTPLGEEHGGNRNWLLVGGLTLQPSELLKLALAVWLGAVLARNRHRLHEPLFLILPAVPVSLFALGLVIWGHDLGTMMVMALLVTIALWVAGAPRRWFGILGVVGAAAIAFLAITSPNRMGRITVWLQGCREHGQLCDQYIEGRYGLAEGGWWGVGLGESRQKWGRLPAAEDDFIFAIIGEELGLFGTLSVVALFVMLAFVLARMIVRSQDPFIQITTGAISAWLIGQAMLNMFVVAGLLPVIGVPLPFISSGGSALVASMLALGMLISFARSEPGAAEALRARASRVRRSFTVLPARSGETARTRRPSRRSRRKRKRMATSGGTTRSTRKART